jgi:hypothetical protein
MEPTLCAKCGGYPLAYVAQEEDMPLGLACDCFENPTSVPLDDKEYEKRSDNTAN